MGLTWICGSEDLRSKVVARLREGAGLELRAAPSFATVSASSLLAAHLGGPVISAAYHMADYGLLQPLSTHLHGSRPP